MPEGRENEAHVWRSSTVRVLTSSDKARKEIATFYQECVEDTIMRDCKDFVESDLPQAAKDDLLAIVAAFGDFSIELWSQKSNVKYYGLKQLEDRVYAVADEEIDLARAVGVEEGDTGLDGRPIPVVVQPLVLGYGSHDGREYDRSRIWSRAIVWVNKEGKVPMKSDRKHRMKFW